MSANNPAFLAAVKVLVAAAEEQRDVLVAAGTAPALLEELQHMVAAFKTASEEARAKQRSHIGARADLQEIPGALMEEVRVLEGRRPQAETGREHNARCRPPASHGGRRTTRTNIARTRGRRLLHALPILARLDAARL